MKQKVKNRLTKDMFVSFLKTRHPNTRFGVGITNDPLAAYIKTITPDEVEIEMFDEDRVFFTVLKTNSLKSIKLPKWASNFSKWLDTNVSDVRAISPKFALQGISNI